MIWVWPDLDLTVEVKKIDLDKIYGIGLDLAKHPNVRKLVFRNDTGKWNEEFEKYPDGVYLGVDYRDNQHQWKIDIWFVKDIERQPDLQHLKEFLPRLTKETRSSIIQIKKEWINRPEYGNKVTSLLIYEAVLKNGIRSVESFSKFLNQ